ncbi:MAG: PCMD domain-containing protein [Bacteroides sp.]|uniref:PCMD domain-containing protein n=1 Tax=Phocaeicola barnesiae TaxID=376804 RepID=UPI00241D745E|nr:PCMD domain-containing protein [Phocaeicola barnesiae]MCD7815939.1 PCMD domain-containing protein [Bacteroides sp.]
MNYKPLLYALLIGSTAVSCIRKEAPNAEADITGCTLPGNVLVQDTIDVDVSYDKSLNAYPIYIQVKKGTDCSQLAPVFTLTPGATIEPESGSTQDFSSPVRYTVTSEDGQWHRTYSISIEEEKVQEIPTTFHFEDTRIENGYYVFYETSENQELTWASGNGGFRLAINNADASEYPTTVEEAGYSGKCAKLVTRTTGSLGAMVGMPIAAGNLFIGKFNLSNALSNPLKATQLGTTFYHKPLKIKGYYKYTPGDKFYANGSYTNQVDKFDIYAIFYENKDENGESVMLDGTLPVLNYENSNLVALAQFNDTQVYNSWQSFEISFDYDRFQKTVDTDRLNAGEYNISIVISSSKDGATFEGAPGSTLWIDELNIIYE